MCAAPASIGMVSLTLPEHADHSADFQQIPSIGIKFAKDLIFLGYYSIEDLKGQNGAEITKAYEKEQGFQTESCVEYQLRLAVDFAKPEKIC